MRGSDGRYASQRTLNLARSLAKNDDGAIDPGFDAAMRLFEGVVALMEGRWRDGISHFESAEQHTNATSIGHSSTRGVVYSMRLMNIFGIGRAGDLLDALPSMLRDMEERNNLYGWMWLTLLGAWGNSCTGQLPAAWAASEIVRARLPARTFELQRWYLEFGQVKFLLIEGKASEAWQRLVMLDKRRGLQIEGQAQRASRLWVRANAALECATQTPSLRNTMLAEARRTAKQLERETAPWIAAIASTVRASIASVTGDDDEALRRLTAVEPQLAAQDLEAVLAAVRLARGKLLGGDEGHEVAARGNAWMTQQRVVPDVARVLVPGSWSAPS